MLDLGNGCTLAVDVSEGGSTALVFVHGYSMSCRTWDRVIPAFMGAGFRCIRYDLRGFGSSSWPKTGYDMRQHAADLRLLLDGLGLDRVVLAGHSLGGAIAQEFALAQPGRLLAAVVSNSAARCVKLPELDAAIRERLTGLAQPEHLTASIRAGIAGYFHPDNVTAAEVEQFRTIALGADPAALHDQLRDIYTAPPLPFQAYAALDVPVLVVSGAADLVTPPVHAEALARAWPRSTMATIANAGHTPMWEQPQAWSQAVLEFLQSHGLPCD